MPLPPASVATATTADQAALAEIYRTVRATTEELAAPLSPEDQVVQSMPDTSPTKWHRAHVTWFFETFLLSPHLDGYEADVTYGFLFNSYYEAVGARHPRPQRGLISRPSVHEIGDYRARVDEAMLRLLASSHAETEEVRGLVVLGLHHEQQHQELLLMDIKHLLSSTILRSPYRGRSHADGGRPHPIVWHDFEPGVVTVGHSGDQFCFDNEQPVHDVLLRPYRLADRLVTAGEWQAFMDDGGYQRPELWLSAGWHHIQQTGWRMPLYWDSCEDGSWVVYTLDGERPIDPGEPVVHVSFYEADAYARWAGARLPSEFEWEHAASTVPVEGNLLPTGTLHPARASGDSAVLQQMFGDVWEWTSSPYIGYPGFRAAPGAVGEYNGKFMIDQMVLRGGCAATPGGHIRPTYRNFFPAAARWQFGGLRLANDQ